MFKIEMLLHGGNGRLSHSHSFCICFLIFLPFSGNHCMFFLMVWNMFLVFGFVKHFSTNLAINIFLLVLRVGIFYISSASLYLCFLLSIKFTAILWTLSISFSLFFDRLEPQTTQLCSTLFLIKVLCM